MTAQALIPERLAGKSEKVNKFFRFLLLLLLSCLAAALPAGGGKEKEPVVQVTGRVRLVGTGPLPELVIRGQDHEWYIDREDRQKLMELQHRTVTVEGNESVRSLKLANGMSAGERHTLKNIKIILVE